MIPVPQKVLTHLAKAYGAPAASLAYFSGGREESDGVLYTYPWNQEQRLLKIMAFPAEQGSDGLFRLEERLRFARFAAENSVRMVFPQLSPLENLYESCEEAGQTWIAYSMEVAHGHTPKDEDQTPEFVRNWGQILGRLHRLTQDYPTWQASVNPATGHALLTWQEEWQDFYNWSKDMEVREKWLALRLELEKLPMQRNSFGFLHNDAHLWNLLVENGEITLLDFDVSNHHWFACDLAVPCSHVLFDQSGGMDKPVYDRGKLVDFYLYFVDGYRREYDLPSEWLDRLDLFIAYRRILLFTVMHGWISSQPEMHTLWRNMILDQPAILGTGIFA